MNVRENTVNKHICRLNMQKSTTKKSISRWDHLRVVSAIARTGTLVGAARELGLDHTTVARQLSCLEQELGEPIFERHRTGLVVTPVGESVLVTSESVESEINHLLRRADSASSNLTGSVRLTATPILAAHVIAPALPRFFKLHPELQVELVADDRILDLSRREADVALRLSRPKTPGLVIKQLGEMAFDWYATSRSKSQHTFLSYEDATENSPLLRHMRSVVGQHHMTMKSNSMHALLETAKAGAGCALLPCLIADRTTGLRRFSGDLQGITLPLWITYHEDLRRSPRIKVIVEFLENELNTLHPCLSPDRK